MNRYRGAIILGTGIFLLAATSMAGVTAATESFVAAAAHAQGSNNSFFATDVRLHNPGPTAATVAIYDLVAGSDNSRASSVSVVVASGETKALDDIVDGLFHRSGAGGLRFTSDVPVIVTSRTYNRTDAGTFAQFIPARTRSEAITAGSVARIVQASRSTSFRTNVGLLDVGGSGANARLTIHNAAGTELGGIDLSVAAFGWIQLEPFAALGLSDVEPAMVQVAVSSGTALTYGSMIDASTNDPNFIEPSIVRFGSGTLALETAAAFSTSVSYRNFAELSLVGGAIDAISSWDQIYEGIRADSLGCTALIDLSSVGGLGIAIGADGGFSAELRGSAATLTMNGALHPDGGAAGTFTVDVTTGSCKGSFGGTFSGRLK